MSAREIIAMSTHSHACDGGYSVVGGAAADAAISALTAAGYRILAPGEIEEFLPGGDWDVAAHVRLLRENGGASSGYTANLIERLYDALNTGGE